MRLNRRGFVLCGGGAAVVAAVRPSCLFAQEQQPLEVACAGSFRAMAEDVLKPAAAARLGLALRPHAQGADAVAKAIVDGSLVADVFVPITATPMRKVLQAGKADGAAPFARTEMVLTYSPKSRFAARLDAAAKGEAKWWDVLQEPGLRISRSDPRADPGGRNVLFVMMLAAKKYNQPDLVAKVLGDPLNPQQVSVANAAALFQSGAIDVVGSYRNSAIASHAPMIPLPAEVNLSGLRVHEEHPEVKLVLGERTFYPEPLVFYAATLKDAPNPKGADAFVRWLQSAEVQGLLRDNGFAPAGEAVELHA